MNAKLMIAIANGSYKKKAQDEEDNNFVKVWRFV